MNYDLTINRLIALTAGIPEDERHTMLRQCLPILSKWRLHATPDELVRMTTAAPKLLALAEAAMEIINPPTPTEKD